VLASSALKRECQNFTRFSRVLCCEAHSASQPGYTQNSNPDVPQLTGCGAKDNATDYCQTLTKSGAASMTMTAAQAKAVARNADGSLPPMK
jgi:hypothetical protein